MYIELKDINKTFGNYKASDHVEFGIEKGKLVALHRLHVGNRDTKGVKK